MLTVYPLERSRGILRFEDREYPCALGCNDVRSTKREGDGVTPAGIFSLRQVFYRPDRLPPPTSGLPVRALGPNDGWCDDPGHRDYNRFVRLPFEASHEALWREDNLYDVIVIVGHNDDPPHPGLGSAIFIHCATQDFAPTQGCVVLARETLVELLPRLAPDIALHIMEAQG
ncbi:MAG: L,D-transpeptidase family protein [Alphaproteobacteria bacterium]|nr:L,D-transpeptidase family protein [Alphaproteobacteria bacterium]